MERTESAVVQQERSDRQSENAYRGVDEHPRDSQGGPGAGFLIASRSGSRVPRILSSTGRHRRPPLHIGYPDRTRTDRRRSAEDLPMRTVNSPGGSSQGSAVPHRPTPLAASPNSKS